MPRVMSLLERGEYPLFGEWLARKQAEAGVSNRALAKGLGREEGSE